LQNRVGLRGSRIWVAVLTPYRIVERLQLA
jgi:hypothetical protein